MMASVFQGDIYEGLSMMVEGDSATFAMPSDSVWQKLFRMPSSPPGMDSIEYIYFHIALNEIMTKEEMQRRKDEEARIALAKEEEDMKEYLRKNYPDAAPSLTGLYYNRFNMGEGELPRPGQMVKVHYTGYLLDGTKFDSSLDRGEPLEFMLGTGRVIKGWDEGLTYMRKGEKGVLILPSKLAYGERGSGNKIPPFSPLVFEIEMIDYWTPEEK
jgi:peptidylprolyl isomerase